ncbi:hypothetical protein [Vibrio agarivorans]|uniref:Uncharacterized protein n=1 Tax=Vibrio agarivorans TaxID=153622 RepID=A0ABT7Y7F0_9VIBR|nr:hypothetical protein [Vibrio agarivorans]MDN2483875.1 hypothetical protein [Vibrio agarivorans]
MIEQLLSLKSATISLSTNSDNSRNLILSGENIKPLSLRFSEHEVGEVELAVIEHLVSNNKVGSSSNQDEVVATTTKSSVTAEPKATGDSLMDEFGL